MKKILVLSLSVVLCISFAGCAKVERSSSTSDSSLVSGLPGGTSESNVSSLSGSLSEVSSSSQSVSEAGVQATSEYKDLISQLDDLKKALAELDQISDPDVTIPTP